MKLYTVPRPSVVHLLRVGDQVALRAQSREPISSEAEYIEADLNDRLVWAAVLMAPVETDRVLGGRVGWCGVVRVTTTHGDLVKDLLAPCITREVIQLDPWSYVRSGPELPRAA